MIKWFIKSYDVDGTAHVVGAWPNGFAVQVDVSLTEDIKSVLNKLNEASAVSYMQMAQGFLLAHVNFQDKTEGEEAKQEGKLAGDRKAGRIPVGAGIASGGDPESTEGKIQV